MSYTLKLLLCLSVLLLPACTKTGNVSPIHDYCLYATPVYVSKLDVFTDDTAKQILTGNETWAAVCRKI